MAEPSEMPIDLAAFNINRERDHGIPSYISYAKRCSNRDIKTFNDLDHQLWTQLILISFVLFTSNLERFFFVIF